jgi:phage shock protein PspC (stress-responsive transcriptional regulator)
MSSPWSLHRSADDAKLAGVCGGVAEHFGVDAVLVRVGAVLLALTGGIGVVLYLAAWLLLPVAGTGRAAVDDLFGGAAARWPRELWVTLVVLASIIAFASFGTVSPFGVGPAIALLAVWWFGFHRPRARRNRPAPGPQPTGPYAVGQAPATPFTQAAAAWQARVAEVRTGVRPPTFPAAPPAFPASQPSTVSGPTWQQPPAAAWQPPPAPAPADVAPPAPAPYAPGAADPEELARAAFLAQPDPVGLYAEPAPVPAVRPGATLAARRLRLVTVLALGLTWLGLGIADALGVGVSALVYAAAGLLVVALGLVAATRFGRARGLLPAGVLLAVAAVVTSGLLGPTLAGPAREATGIVAHPVSYTSAAAFPAGGDRVDIGSLDVDLTGLVLTSDATYTASVDAGRLDVRTPPGVGVALRYTADTGSVYGYGREVEGGTDLRGERLLVAPAAGQRTLTLDLGVDTGTIQVRS